MLARIVILNWNGRQWLEACLTSVLADTAGQAEVVLVDNGSTDGSADFVEERFPAVVVTRLGTNLGFAGGNNAGAAGAATKYLVFLNNDTRVRPGWLAALLRAAEGHPARSLVTSRIVYLDAPDVIDSAGDGYLRCGGGFKRLHGQPADIGDSSREVFGACGAAFLIRRDVFDALGGFDEDFFMVYEDVDLSYRARLQGAVVWYAADAVVEHAGSASMGRVSDRAVYYGQRNLEWTWLKNTPTPLLWRSFASHVAYNLAGALAYARRGRLGPWLRGKGAALGGLRAVWRKRVHIQRTATARPQDLQSVMDTNWVAVKRAEKRFDFRPGISAS